MKIYLGIPYTGTEEESFKNVNRIAAKLMKEGHVVFSPISQNHPITLQERTPSDWGYWKKFLVEFIDWCDVVYIYKMKGWEKSIGVQGEIARAIEIGKSITFIEEGAM